jgi:hypothetical protein
MCERELAQSQINALGTSVAHIIEEYSQNLGTREVRSRIGGNIGYLERPSCSHEPKNNA